jgi:hypothetical protein
MSQSQGQKHSSSGGGGDDVVGGIDVVVNNVSGVPRK